MNIILNSDSYKYTMHVQYPPGTEHVYSYIESRGGKYDKMVFFGLQGFINEYLSTPITKYDIDEAERCLFKHVGVFNREGWDYILEKHNGFLPVSISAVPEGTVLPVKNCILTIVNTDPKCYWLTTFLETALLRAIWYPTTIATQGYYTRNLIQDYLNRTCGGGDVDYMLHDFGLRGCSSLESSMIGGLAHLVNFKGTDNVPALVYANDHYGCNMAGHSVPAMEHSTVTGWGRDNEFDSYNNMVDQYSSSPIVSSVSDSYDIFAACHYVGQHLKDKIIANNQTYVIRPDSGDPKEVILKCLDILERYFPCERNCKGYKKLEHVKILWGDGINHDSIEEILYAVTMADYSTDNFVFGSGGALLQQMNRDTMKFAMKCSAICVDGKWRDVYKDPITDNGKSSKRGLVTLYKNDSGEIYTDVKSSDKCMLLPVYGQGGIVYNQTTLDEIRNRALAG